MGRCGTLVHLFGYRIAVLFPLRRCTEGERWRSPVGSVLFCGPTVLRDWRIPRSTINRRHPLVSVVVIALIAGLAGAAGPTAIAKWAALKEEFLLEFFYLRDGIPCKDVFRRVLVLLKPTAFRTSFANWLQSLEGC